MEDRAGQYRHAFGGRHYSRLTRRRIVVNAGRRDVASNSIAGDHDELRSRPQVDRQKPVVEPFESKHAALRVQKRHGYRPLSGVFELGRERAREPTAYQGVLPGGGLASGCSGMIRLESPASFEKLLAQTPAHVGVWRAT